MFVCAFAEHWPFLFGRAFHTSGQFTAYILGDISRDEANRKLRFYITDPVAVYETWFENYGRENPLPKQRDPIAKLLTAMTAELRKMQEEHTALSAEVKTALRGTGENALSPDARKSLINIECELQTFGSEMSTSDEMAKHPAWVEAVGPNGAILTAQAFHSFHREKRAIRPSDAIDLNHLMYLPHADLWRGDRAFSTLLIKNRVNFHERIVPALSELPDRIESEIAKRCSR
jgi:hypothetical protein